jgi:hypothetical protein
MFIPCKKVSLSTLETKNYKYNDAVDIGFFEGNDTKDVGLFKPHALALAVGHCPSTFGGAPSVKFGAVLAGNTAKACSLNHIIEALELHPVLLKLKPLTTCSQDCTVGKQRTMIRDHR